MHPFDEIKAFVGFDDDDTGRLRQLLPHVEPQVQAIADRFYDRIHMFPDARGVFEDEAQVGRLKVSLVRWIREVLSGPHDHAYYERHLSIGHRHMQVGLPQQYMFTAMNLLRTELTGICRASSSAEECYPLTLSLMRILDLELAVMLETYVHDTKTRDLVDLRNLLMQNLPISAMLLDAEGGVTVAAGALQARQREGEHGSAHYTELLDPDLVQAADLPARVRQAVETGQAVEIPRLDMHRGDELHSYRLAVVPLEHPQARLLVHIEDLTEMLAQDARSRHEENLAQLGQMSAAIAHELRNPLAGFSATMQVLLGSLPAGERRRAIMAKVLEQITRLDGLVADLLQFARPVQAECQDVDLREVARRVCSQIALADVGRSVVVGSGVGYADTALLQQAVYNLVLNGWQAGATRVEVRVKPGALEVVDDGPGVPEPRQSEIFKPFVTTRTRGTGLGLPNAQRFIEAMGGTLKLTASSLGGAGFRIQLLPAQTASRGHASPSDSEGHSD